MNRPGCNLVVSDRSFQIGRFRSVVSDRWYLIIHRFRIFELCPKDEDLASVYYLLPTANYLLPTALSAPWTTLIMKYSAVLDLIVVDEWEPPCHAVL
jgi:hypothetical protein